MDKLKIDGKAIILGRSVGGRTAIEFGYSKPNRTSCILL